MNSGEAGGTTYVHSGSGWEEVTASWHLPDLPINYMGLIVKVPLDIAIDDTLWIDAMTVNSTGSATITTQPEGPPVPAVRAWLLAAMLLIMGVFLLHRKLRESRA